MHYLPQRPPDLTNFPTAEDCPRCGLPTLVAVRYAGIFDQEVRLDAMPVRTFSRTNIVPYGGCVIADDETDRYVEHACLDGIQ